MRVTQAIALFCLLLTTASASPADAGKQPNYTLPNSWELADQRLQLLEDISNPRTFAMLTRLGINKGWNCLDIGSGKGGVADWMRVKVGETGSVTATDINIDFLNKIKKPGLKVLEHNIATDPLPQNYYDLIHVRDVLIHLPGKQQSIIEKLYGALKPGGILVVDDMGIFDAQYRLSTLDAPEAVWKKEGADYEYLENKKLMDFHTAYLNHQLFRKAGFINVDAETIGKLAQGGDTTVGRFMYLSTLQLDTHQNRTPEEKEQYEGILKAYQNPDSYWWDHFQVITWGKKPSANTSGQ